MTDQEQVTVEDVQEMVDFAKRVRDGDIDLSSRSLTVTDPVSEASEIIASELRSALTSVITADERGIVLHKYTAECGADTPDDERLAQSPLAAELVRQLDELGLSSRVEFMTGQQQFGGLHSLDPKIERMYATLRVGEGQLHCRVYVMNPERVEPTK